MTGIFNVFWNYEFQYSMKVLLMMIIWNNIHRKIWQWTSGKMQLLTEIVDYDRPLVPSWILAEPLPHNNTPPSLSQMFLEIFQFICKIQWCYAADPSVACSNHSRLNWFNSAVLAVRDSCWWAERCSNKNITTASQILSKDQIHYML